MSPASRSFYFATLVPSRNGIWFPFCLTQSGHLQEVCANACNCIPFYGRLHRKVAMHLSILELNYVCSKHRKSEQELGALCFCTPNQISSDVCWSCFQAVLCTCHTPTAGCCLKYIIECFLAQFPYWEVEKSSVFICLSCSTENMREIDTCLQLPEIFTLPARSKQEWHLNPAICLNQSGNLRCVD